MDIKYDVMIVDKDKWRRFVTSLYSPCWPHLEEPNATTIMGVSQNAP